MSRRVFATVTLDSHGGGIATASRLTWQALQDRWEATSRLVTLVPSVDGALYTRPTAGQRIRFASRLAAAQVVGRSPWVLYGHVSLAKVQNSLPRALRSPYAIFLYGIEAWRPLSRGQVRAIRGATLLVAISRHTARRVREANPWIGEIAECPLALPDPIEISGTPTVAANGLERSPAVIVVARMSATERYKGHDQLLEAWPMVQCRLPEARLIFVGGGDDIPRLRAKSESLCVRNGVVFTGFVSADALRDLYRQAQVFAMPSRDEGFGLVYLEAMANGLPCIGSVHDAAGEVIVDGVTGYLVDQGDIKGIADRIVRLLSDASLRARMGEEGRRRLHASFMFARFKERLVSLLLQAFGDAGG